MDDYEGRERFDMENDYEDGQWINGPDLTKPVQFVSTGTVMPDQEIDKENGTASENPNSNTNPSQAGLGYGLGFQADSSRKTDGGEADDVDAEFLPTAFGRKIKEGAQRREKEREKERSASTKAASVKKGMGKRDAGAGKFEAFTSGIGSKLLRKMGYKGGGLGKDEQGITAPIEVKMRPQGMGMGYNDYKEVKMPALDEKEPEEKPAAKLPASSKEKRWLKQKQGRKKTESKYLTPEELLLQKQEQGLEDTKVQKVLDMRGPQVRVLSNLENLNAEEEAKENQVPMPELQHNVKLIVDMAEVDIQRIDRDLRREREKVVSLQREKDKFQKEELRQRKQLQVMETIAGVVERVGEENSLGVLNLESLLTTFSNLKQQYKEEYKLCNLSCIVCSFAYPLLIRVFQGWQPLQNPHHGLILMASWKSLLQGDQDQPFDYSENPVDASPYTRLVNELIFPAVRISGTNSWKPRDPEPMLRFLESWEQLLPPSLVQSILQNVVMPKLLEAVDEWNPLLETVPIHSWVHPWLPHFGQELQPLYHRIWPKFDVALRGWHASDSSAYAVLSPWKDVFDAASWERLIVRWIVPKLIDVMKEFQVNPANQILDQWNWVMTWALVIPIHHMVNLLEVEFFSKWHRALYGWLCLNPDFNEVTRWYMGWKSLFPPELLANERIRQLLTAGLDMMKQAAEGAPVVQPGVRENVSYLRVTEQRQFEAQQQAAAARAHADNLGNAPLKDQIQFFAEEQGVLFVPKVGKLYNSLQVYGFGNVNICIDYPKQLIYAQSSGGWLPVSLSQLLQMHRNSAQR
ncbi:uncharacterized protein A4U43_C05F13850 [Asparagus officinalis]|uniref:G-patch domain-containing protein n=1 Tax=Asparagus officinalis TaxID=4686 RepID=A0A5P1ESH7_ASPOF|nr:septin and tuftelin-interacting protein 1 homolog 1 [Asparagus officinalis]ONK68603.1 uncharacterized protein A4U43_C05F13850 [Asparagus officinalis]